METRSVGKPSSPHANSTGDSQCAQSSVGDAQTQSAADPCDHPYAQISTVDTQIERWSQFDIDPCDPPWSRIEYHWLLQVPPCECQKS